MSDLTKLALGLSVCLSLALAASACKQNSTTTANPTPAADSTADQNAAISRQFYDEAFNKGNMGFVDAHAATNFTDHDAPPGNPGGIDGLKKAISDWRAAFPDTKVTVEDVVAKGDEVMVRTMWTGTQKGPFMGMPPSNKAINIEGIDIVKIKDGKATDRWGQSDVMKMMQQLGKSNGPGGAPPTATPGAGTQMPADSTAKKDTSMKGK